MADINSKRTRSSRETGPVDESRSVEPGVPPGGNFPRPGAYRNADQLHIELTELLFFAYRDFTGEPDAVLQSYHLGRAHHRVLHFINRHPGLRVADLLEILKITKQSLARVLKQLVDDGWIEQRPGAEDRRERHLSLTPRGIDLAMRLQTLQSRRIAAALAEASIIDPTALERFLFAMISVEERLSVRTMIGHGPGDSKASRAPAGPNSDEQEL